MHPIDGTLLAKAIVFALVTIDALPPEQRVPGERDDIVHILHLMIQDPAERERLAAQVAEETGALPDLTDWKARNWRPPETRFPQS